ncbi:MAG TPA: hypothetical protein VFK37_08170, partial [Bacillales bacterium]|nr:hypothetical protein [Bacillales bacterium]
MNKILIAITSNVSEKDQIEINKIYESFDNNGYIIELFEDNEEQIQIDNLPSLIDMVLSKEMYRNNVEHLVILSNIRPLLLGWYRCYNSLADDFILYINENEMSRKTHRKYLDFVDALSSFDAGEMKNEDLHGRIYLNSFSLSSRFGDFLFPGERFKYFHSLSEFPFQPESQKEGILKEYLYKGSEYTFIIKSYTEKQRITLTQPNRKPTIVINDELLSFLEANPDFMLHAFMNIYLQKANHDVKFQALKQLIKSFSSFNVEDQILFYNQVVSHMNHNQFSFQQQAYIFSIMVQLAGSKDVVLQDIMKLMLNDHQHIEYHYPLLINTRFYSNNKQLKDYPEVINDRMKVMDKIRD